MSTCLHPRRLIVWLVLLLGFAALAPAQPRVLLGIDVFEKQRFRQVEGKRVGLLTHAAGVNRFGTSSVDVLRRSPRVNLVALFGPEHGIYGDAAANEKIEDGYDPRSGLPVYSLYGATRRPTPDMLERIDVMVIDLQDIGVRSYTYVSSMRYAVEACFQAGVEVVILDRPNPLGGLKVDGPPLDRRWMSFVGAFQVPYVHGLTIGELARMSKANSGWFQVPDAVRQAGRLSVVPMEGWRRDMMWTDTGLPWVPTSPNIPSVSAVLGYAMTGLGQQHSGFSHGIGTPYPFRLLRHREKSPAALLRALRDLDLRGIEFRVVDTRTHAGAPISGVFTIVNDWRVFRPTELSFYMMKLGAEWSNGNPYARLSEAQMTLFNKHVGSTEWWDEISSLGAQARVWFFIQKWTDAARRFQQRSKQFWLY